MAQRRVLVCCATGIATSVQVSHRLKELLKARGMSIEVAECKVIELPARVSAFRPHAVVSTTQVDPKLIPVRVFPGLPFLTGLGIEAATDEIAAHLKSLSVEGA